MGGLHHVGSVHIVVIGDVAVVVVLQSHHEGDEGVNGNLEGFQEVSLLMARRKKNDSLDFYTASLSSTY